MHKLILTSILLFSSAKIYIKACLDISSMFALRNPFIKTVLYKEVIIELPIIGFVTNQAVFYSFFNFIHDNI